MKRSAKPKALDVPATSVSARSEAGKRKASSSRRKQSAKATPTEVAPPLTAADPVAASFEATLDHPLLMDEWEDPMTDEEDLWDDNFEAAWEDDDIEAAIADDDDGEDAFDLAEEWEDELEDEDDLVAELATDAAPSAIARLLLERGLVKALAAPESTDFMARLSKTLQQAAAQLPSLSRVPVTAHSRPRAKRNGHHPDLRRQVLAQPLQQRLRQLAVLTQRYQKRSLSEFDLLEDAIALLDDSDRAALTTVLAGLAARIASQPVVKPGSKSWGAGPRSHLLTAAQKAVNLLAQADSLEALPGLAATVGQRLSQTASPPATWPTTFYHTARKVAASPRLQQRLSAFEPSPGGTSSLLINAHEMPVKVRVNAPLEIVFRQPRGQ